eukprot:Phypoly_transcript_05193.p1 GENE.Phypoly_transcript_05193~~Phypoly_transcript_05193.p1  ORF type:complete len:508 (+),score=66.47 Phypoly_transcript_05193:116-1639(+)
MYLFAQHHVPEIMRGAFITKGYRFNYTWQMCLKSVFRAHNETLNVWTHFIGFLIFAGLLIHTIYHATNEAPMPTFPSTDFTFPHNFFDMAQKYYEGHFPPSMHPQSLSTCMIPSSSPPTCPLPSSTSFPTCPLTGNITTFPTFPAFSSTHHQPYSFFNFTSFPSLYCNLANFPNLPQLPAAPFSFDFVTFPSFSTDATFPSFYTDSFFTNETDLTHLHTHAHTGLHTHAHTFQSHLEQAVKTKSEELKKFLADCRDQLQRKMHSFHDSFEEYLKEIEKSVHEFPHNTHNLSERLSEMRQRFDDNWAKFFSPKSKLPIVVFLLSGMACFMGSTLYHTFGCQSVGHCAFFLKVDYSGISTLIAGSLVPFVWYVFHGLTHWQCFYVIVLFLLAVLVLYVSLSEQFSSEEYQPYRALCFVLMAAFAVIPFVHMVFLYGTVEIYAFQRFALSALLYGLAVAAYVSRVPERLFPGRCDFLLQSHQVFHTFIVAAALVWYTFALRLLDSNVYIN